MRIYSDGDHMVAFFPATGVRHEWYKGSHTVNVTTQRGDMDCYTFAWEKSRTNMLDFTSALEEYLNYA